MSQSCVTSLAALVDGHPEPDFDSLYDLDDADEAGFFDSRDHSDKTVDLSPIRLLVASKTQHLFSHPRLGNLVNKLHYILYLHVNEIKRDQDPSQIDLHLDTIESLIDYIGSQAIGTIKFESVDRLLLSVFYSVSALVHISGQRLDSKVGSISAKILGLFDGKLAEFDSASDYRCTLFKQLKYVVYLITKIRDPKSIVTMWKLFSKFVFKLKTMVPCAETHMMTLRKISEILVDDQKKNLKCIKTSLSQPLDDPSCESVSLASQSISSQLRLKNHVVQDTLKIIKLSSFLFKILCTFVRLHLNDILTDAATFEPFFIVLVQINSMLLTDMARNENDEATRRFHTIKLDFTKEFAANFDQLLTHVLTETRLVNALNDLPAHSDDYTPHELLLFYSVCSNRAPELDLEPTLERVMNLMSLGQAAIYSPVYCSYSKKFTQDGQLNFSRFIADFESTIAIEFYDLVVVLVGKFILQSGLNPDKMYYLMSNLASNEPIRCRLSYDLIIYFIRNYAATSNNSNFMSLVKFVSLVYESSGLGALKQLLAEILIDAPSGIASDLEQFYAHAKLYRCMLVVGNSSHNLISVVLLNTVGLAIDLIDGLETIFTSSGNETLALRKSMQFIQANKMIQVVGLCSEVMGKCVGKVGLGGDFGDRMARRLMGFIRMEKIDTLLANPDNHRLFYQLLLKLLNTFAMALYASSATDDDELVSFLLEFYLKNTQKRCESLKFEAAEFTRLLAKRKQSLNSQHQQKTIELVQQIVSEPLSAMLTYFALECVNEYSNSNDATKNRVFCQLNRLGLNQLINNNLIEIQLDPDFDVAGYVCERAACPSRASQDPLGTNLDETMNVLMSAMDTTISADVETDTTSSTHRDKLESIEADLTRLFESYPSGRLPGSLRSQLKHITQLISKNI